MSTFVKKILVSAVAALVVATVAMPPAAQAQTAAELQAQIQSLLATIAQLQAQLSGVTGGGSMAGIPAGFTFTRNLAQGASGSDVMYLQILLNSNSATRVASSGAGSPGQETQFFGPLTAIAVSAFQNLYASSILSPLGLSSGTGFFGASSRAKANMLIASAPAPTPGTPSPTPGTPSPTPGISTPGVEGSLVVTLNTSVASGAILTLNESKAVGAIDVKATGSDVLVSRLDLQFDVRPYLYISEVTVTDGSTTKTMSVTSSNSTEVTVGSKYSVRVDGLNILIPKDTTKKFTVRAKSVSGLPAGTATKDLVMTFIQNSVRGTDGAGLTQTAPTADLSTRTFTVKEGDTADLEITANTTNPKARNVVVNSTAETTDVVLAVVDVKAKNNDAILRSVDFIDTVASGTLDIVGVYDGSTLLSSTSSIGTASATIENINLTLKKDTTKTLTLKATVKKASGNYAESASSTIKWEANKAGFNAEDASSFAAATISGSTVLPGTAYLYTKSPKITLVSTSITGAPGTSGSSSPQEANASIRVNVEALGGDIYVMPVSTTYGSSGLSATTSVPASLTVTETISTNALLTADEAYKIPAGETRWFEYQVNMVTNTTAGDFFANAKPVHILWDTTNDSTTWAAGMPQTWVVDEFRTTDLLLKATL